MKRQSWKREEIMSWIRRNPEGITSSEMVQRFKMSRQTAARALRALVEDGQLTKTGSTQKARYRIAKKGEGRGLPRHLKLKKSLKGLAEDRVFDEAELRMNLKAILSDGAHRIVYYAFGEMLNNAVDHSASAGADIDIWIEKGCLRFVIRDFGIGIFANIKNGFKLESEEEAVEHLLKGKQTTAPEAHSGQGIFFTSKIADFFALRSHRLLLKFDNEKDNLSLGQVRPLKGTEVEFRIKCKTRKSLKELFEEYANEDFEFDRTKYPIIVLQQSGSVSRSQARRLTLNLDRFDRVILDFTGVTELGQGFADEIFRVFQNRHPKMVLEVRNANAAVNFMIRRAQQS